MASDIVTRFAPSPTGFLHIGGARTALFNWLFARHHGGKMLLRIEDTDRERSTEAAYKAIIAGLNWLELGWEGDVISQNSRRERHVGVAQTLLADGNAYRCYASQEELAAMREAARAEGRPPRYDGTWRDRDPAEAPEGVTPVIRFRAPQEGSTIIEDQVQGRVEIPNKDLDDLIIQRSDGSPTYNLSVVVDDHDMSITHVIRGVDHLTNAARQAQIYRALGWHLPVMAHIPLIHGPDGAKLSKRHGALGVEAYRAMGYLPTAMRNYLARLGWAHGDDEIFSIGQAIEWFDLPAVGKSPARFDFVKLKNLNGHYIREADDDELAAELERFVPLLGPDADAPKSFDEETREKVRLAMPGLKARAKTLVELWEGARFIVAQRPLDLDEKAAKLLDEDGRAVLAGVCQVLAACETWDVPTLEDATKAYAEETGVKLGKVAQPLRAALTGRAVSPGIFDVLAVLGREESLARMADQAQ